jgi:hypothetical protein
VLDCKLWSIMRRPRNLSGGKSTNLSRPTSLLEPMKISWILFMPASAQEQDDGC